MRLTEIAHQKILRYCPHPKIAVDATIGNGYDTLFLQKILSPEGKLWGFDIQTQAIAVTHQKLSIDPRIYLIKDSHAKLSYYLEDYQGKVDLIIYNLGYLPHSDKRVTTLKKSTLDSIIQAIGLLRKGGVISILAYPGHPQGKEEAEAIKEFINTQKIETVDFSYYPEIPITQEAPFLCLGIKQ